MVLSHDASSCLCIFVALLPPSATLLCVVVCCADARDARGCVSTLCIGCQTSSCCCSACVPLTAFTRCLPLLCCCCSFCCCCVPIACLHVHGVAVVVLWRARPSQCHCLVEWDDGVRYLWAVWLCRFRVTRARCCA